MQDIAHVTVQVITNAVDGMEPHAACLPAAQDGKVCLGDADLGAQLLGRHAPRLEHIAQRYPYGHGAPLNNALVVVVDSLALLKVAAQQKERR